MEEKVELNEFEKELLSDLHHNKLDWIEKTIAKEIRKSMVEHNLNYEEFEKNAKKNKWPAHTETCAICNKKIDVKDEINLHRVSVVKQDKILNVCLSCGQGAKYLEWVNK